MITLYGRMPVLEALLDPQASIEKVVVARTARGEAIDRIIATARDRGVKLELADAQRVTRISRNGRHDQGVVADIASPGLGELEPWLDGRPGPCTLILLDGVTNPANVGMVIRTAVGAGVDGVVLPRSCSPDVGPLVVKASAGVALAAPILRAPTAAAAVGALQAHGVAVVGLATGMGSSVWSATVPARVAVVVGNETEGISAAVASQADAWWNIPLAGGINSLNVATAASVVAFELARRRAVS